MTCCACGNALPDEAAFCPECGARRDGATVRIAGASDAETGRVWTSDPCLPVSPSPRLPVSAPPSIDALLARANLLRMRGQWADAVERCTEALRADPHNPAAHSLLGDIYENQGRVDKAIHWYQLALEQNPESVADKAKLARARELQAVRRRTGDSRLSWAYLVAVAGVAFLFVAFVMAAIVAADRRRGATSAVAGLPMPAYRLAAAPREQPPDHTTEEESLARFLIDELHSPFLRVSGVLLGPVDGEAIITARLDDRTITPDPMGGGRRGRLLREVYRIVYLARQQQQERKRDLRFVTIRALSQLSSGGGAGPVEPVWYGRVNVTRLGAPDDRASAQEVQQVFDPQQMWWSPLAGL